MINKYQKILFNSTSFLNTLDFCESFLLHIPHSSTIIPDYNGFFIDKIENDINLTTDFATDKIFDIDGIDKLIFPYSRLFCDVERFSNDEEEMMSKIGRGFFYTKTIHGENLRINNQEIKENIYLNYYLPHHNKLDEFITNKINKNNFAIIIDCHSFDSEYFENNLIKNSELPDICLGVDEFHTPEFLYYEMKNYFESIGFTVDKNNPFSGSIVPTKFYRKDKRVKSIMIEINKKIYMKNNIINEIEVNKLKKIITVLLKEKISKF